MRIVLLGGNGMAGHMLAAYLKRNTVHEIIATVRPRSSSIESHTSEALEGLQVLELDVRSLEATGQLIEETSPDVILNAVGILNQQAEIHPLDAYRVNGLLPHWLRHKADLMGARLIHISSDCVFSGMRGGYREEDTPDGVSVYARSKAFGELRNTRHLTIRTSIIGPDNKPDGIGLMQWFLAQQGEVRGYRRVLWNGVTTLELAKSVEWLLGRPGLAGLVHLTAPEKVSKHDLLYLMGSMFDKTDVTIVPDLEPVIDRTLVRTREDFDYRTMNYAEMLGELRKWMDSP
jgi:dTDP-4-dehydrorhamnose reductase